MSHSGGSRLQKLLKLIDDASNVETRKAAAVQIAAIAASHPQQFPYILKEVSSRLYHKDWDTRVAASHCLGCLADHFVHHTPLTLEKQLHGSLITHPPIKQETDNATTTTTTTANSTNLSFASFDISTVLEQGTPLLASAGEEYDLPHLPSPGGTTPSSRAERIALQRSALQKRLGLGGFMESFMDTAELIEDKDLDIDVAAVDVTGNGGRGTSVRQRKNDTLIGKTEETASASHHQHHQQQEQATQKGANELLKGMSVRERAMKARAMKRAGNAAVAAGSADPDRATPTIDNTGRNAKRAKLSSTDQDIGASGAASMVQHQNNSSSTQGITPDASQVHLVTPSKAAVVDDSSILESQWQAMLSGQWPFQDLCDQVCMDVLHPRWETRHGACLALREVLRSHAQSAAVHAAIADPAGGWSEPGGMGTLHIAHHTPVEKRKEKVSIAIAANQEWLEDCAIHLLCTLALDRLDDFGSDQSVAPVRETAAQALGAVTRPFDSPAVLSMLGMLRTMSSSGRWQARHGALQALKYVFAARESIDRALYAAALPVVIRGLQDPDDDVRAVAAEAMLPAASLLAVDRSTEGQSVRALLWDSLLSLEDLSPAVKGISTLLAAVYSAAAEKTTATAACLITSRDGRHHDGQQPSIDVLIHRLWPHMRHTLSSVRLSSVRCFAALLRSLDVNVLLPDDSLLSNAVRIIYQNMLMEKNDQIIEQYQGAWAVLMHNTPIGRLSTSLGPDGLAAMVALGGTLSGHRFDTKYFVSGDSHSIGGDNTSEKKENRGCIVEHDRAATMRLRAAQCLGRLTHALASTDDGPHPMESILVALIQGSSVAGRVLAAFICIYWIEAEKDSASLGSMSDSAPGTASSRVSVKIINACMQQLMDGTSQVEYLELAGQYTAVRRLASSLSSTLQQYQGRIEWNEVAGLSKILSTAGGALTLADVTVLADAAAQHALRINSSETINISRILKTDAIPKLAAAESMAKTTATAALAACIVYSGRLPDKLNPLIQSLMGGTRREPERALQERYAHALARLVLDASNRVPSPSEKMIKNIAVFACGDGGAVPNVASPPSLLQELGLGDSTGSDGGSASKTAGSAHAGTGMAAEAAALTRKGGEAALRSLVTIAGQDLVHRLPALWDTLVTRPLSSLLPTTNASASATAAPTLQAAVNAAHLLCIIAPAIHPSLLSSCLSSLLPSLAACLSHSNVAVQLSAARALAAVASSHPQHGMPSLLETMDTLLSPGAAENARLGGVVSLDLVVSSLGLRMVPYVQLAVVPLLGRMSDPIAATRSVASRCFASVVALIPLAQDVPPPPGLSAAQLQSLQKDGGFLQRLLDNRKVEDFTLPFSLLTGTLRPYQQEGINWLAFLRRFGLHGVLADDMGLGKTLQATAIIAATMYEQRQKYSASNDVADTPRPSLIVCPSTLVAHWPHEVGKFVGADILQPLQYHGTSAVRKQLQSLVKATSLVVLSYESLRSDIEWLSGIKWAYCVLDEGHAIRNPSSKIAQAARRIDAQHRLILSGTPIQNSIQELWALFEFLMPGFLGPQRAFHARFGKAVAASRVSYKKGPSMAASTAEAGVLALDSLHRQVMPFVLRRTKGEVLQDLPPKTVQDVVCDPSELQRALYEDFAASKALEAVTGAVQNSLSSGSAAPPHVFQALHYLRKLCSHPLLVLDAGVPAHGEALKKLFGSEVSKEWESVRNHLLTDIMHSPKLAVLKELLIDCGIGIDRDEKSGELQATDTSSDAGHRALIFAQSRAFLDIVETSVLQPLSITSLRIDGSVDATERFRRVQVFNADPTIEVMLLTTAVGGLGLNLTAADTVIFLEHDWNPQKDLQAMDRAHRLGQKRAVNVYRLLIRGTLEEHIMSLQKFKLDIADAVVNTDNVSLSSMNTGNLLDLLTLREEGAPSVAKKSGQQEGGASEAVAGVGVGGGKGGGLAAMLAEMADPEAAEAQYGEEFDLESFKKKLLGKKA